MNTSLTRLSFSTKLMVQERRERADVNDTWKHDLFETEGRRDERRPSSPPRNRRPFRPRTFKIFLENMSYDVIEEDIRDLLQKYESQIVNVRIEYDKAGRSEGRGFVLFREEDAADSAMREFDGVDISGRALKITRPMVVAEEPRRRSYDSKPYQRREMNKRW
jgi:THO complex subunit 4